MTEEMPLPGAMPKNLPENAPMSAGFAPVDEARRLLRTCRVVALGTIDRNTGHPVTTLATMATDMDGAPIILISGLSSHTANLVADPRASVLISTTGKGDPLAYPRLTVLGSFRRIDDDVTRVRARRRFLARHPKGALYADFGDFGFWRMAVASGHLNGGFARAADVMGADLIDDLAGMADLIAAEESALAHMNEDHVEAIRLYATRLCGEAEGPWRMISIDPGGAELAAGERIARLAFPRTVASVHDLNRVLVELVARARAG